MSKIFNDKPWYFVDRNESLAVLQFRGKTHHRAATLDLAAQISDIESGFLLIARVQDDDTITWDRVADMVTVNALGSR